MIRIARPSDQEDVCALLRYLDAEVVSSDDLLVYVAERSGCVAGMVTLCPLMTLTGRKALLDHLVVDPSWRRQGVGRALVEHAIETARALGASRIDLTAGRDKQEARALYQQLGFVERPALRLDLLDSGTPRLRQQTREGVP